jgi:hypothetical protein
MSALIDFLLQNTENNSVKVKIGKMYWIAKPLAGSKNYRKLIKDSIRVLKGKSIAVHYEEDE